VYDHRPSATTTPFNAWYRASLLASLRYVIAETVRLVVPLIVIAAAIYGLQRSGSRAQMAVLTGAAVACLVTVPLNPVPSSFARVVLLPLIPVFCGIVQCAGEALLVRASAKAPAEPAPEAA
jgi:hypothetical protein